MQAIELFDLILTIGGAAGAIFTMLWAIIKYVNYRVEKERDERIVQIGAERKERKEDMNELRSKLDNMVVKEDFHRNLDEVKVNINTLGTQLNARLDMLIQVVMKGEKN